MNRQTLRATATALSALVLTAATVTLPAPASATACGSTFSGGAGTLADPWLVSTASDLNALQSDVNCWANTMFFAQTVDIDMGGATWTTAGIGTGSDPFLGTYDGGSHRISGLTITAATTSYLGLFGILKGTIRQLGFTGDVTGEDYVGGLVGQAVGSASVSGSYATGDVSGQDYVGGLVGYYDGTGSVSGSYATGAATGRYRVGGLAGVNYGSVSSAYARGAVHGDTAVGGLIGWNRAGLAAVSKSYATGAVTGTADVGGFIGSNSGPVSDSFWDTQTSGTSTGISTGTTTGATGETTALMQAVTTFSSASWSIVDGWSASSTWGMCPAVNSGYPYLTSLHASDPCSGGSAPDSTSSTPTRPATYAFTFLATGGGLCFQQAGVSAGGFQLPSASVACVPEGSDLVGWSIPGQSWAFTPSRVVMASGDQSFTAVARSRAVAISYDANVSAGTSCLAAGAEVPLVGRTVTIGTARDGSLAATAACTPAGLSLAGWTDQPTIDGPGSARAGAGTFTPGGAVPTIWALGPNPVNDIRLYALWAPASRR